MVQRKSADVEIYSPETVAPTLQVPAVYAAVAAIAAAMAESGLGKDRRNESQKFNFRGIDDVLNVLARLYVQQQLIVLPAYANRVVTERASKNGGMLFSVAIEGVYTLKSLRDGSELRVGPFIGEAMDSGDKATNKAMSIAYKYFAIQTFAIPTEGDNDPDATSHEVAGGQQSGGKTTTVAPSPHAPLLAEIDSFAPPACDKLAALIRKAYGVDSIARIPVDKIPEAIERAKKFRVAVDKAAADNAALMNAQPRGADDDLPV